MSLIEDGRSIEGKSVSVEDSSQWVMTLPMPRGPAQQVSKAQVEGRGRSEHEAMEGIVLGPIVRIDWSQDDES